MKAVEGGNNLAFIHHGRTLRLRELGVDVNELIELSRNANTPELTAEQLMKRAESIQERLKPKPVQEIYYAPVQTITRSRSIGWER